MRCSPSEEDSRSFNVTPESTSERAAFRGNIPAAPALLAIALAAMHMYSRLFGCLHRVYHKRNGLLTLPVRTNKDTFFAKVATFHARLV